MSGETADQESGWTIDTALSHMRAMMAEADKRYEQRFMAQEKSGKDALAEAEKAVIKAERAVEKRLENQNEFRGQLADQANTFMPRAEAERSNAYITERVTDIASRMDRLEGHSRGLASSWGYLVGVAGMAAAGIGIILAVIK